MTMNRKRQLLAADEAVEAKSQHNKPCSDCPFARKALAGWIGSLSIDEWVRAVHGEARIDCHTLDGAQCAGAAIYRANVWKHPRNPELLVLPADRERVFGNPVEFRMHHEDGGGRRTNEPTLWWPLGTAMKRHG
jgi:hypothetical protein